MKEDEIERITPEKAMEVLNKGGLKVDIEQAKLILDFLYKMADIAIAQVLRTPE